MPDRPILFHRIDAEGEPLLLLNGIAMTINSWQPIAEPLAREYRVVRCDLRGQLMSPGNPPSEVAGHGEDVVALLDSLGIESAHIIGTSFGGVVATMVAARWPERVRSLISIASTDGFDDVMAVEVRRWREACLLSITGPDRGLLSDMFEGAVYSPTYIAEHREERAERRRQISILPDAWFQGLAAMLDSAPTVSVRNELGSIRCPALIIAAELDRFIPIERTRLLARRIPGARFTLMEGAGHAVVVEQPDALVSLCLEFLSNIGDTV